MTPRPLRRAANAIVLALVVLACAVPTFSRPAGDPAGRYAHEVWDANRGLLSFSINAMAQGPDGYLWLGTDDGLARFDGVQFTMYTTANTPALRHNNISALCVQPDSTLWIATTGGGVSLLRDGVVTQWAGNAAVPTSNLLSLAPGRGGPRIGSASGGFFAADGAALTRFRAPVDGLRPVHAICAGKGGRYDLGFGGYLAVHAPGSDSIALVARVGSLVFSLCERRDSTVVVGAMDGVFLYDGTAIRPFPDPAVAAIRSARAILEDHAGNLWIGTEGYGLYRYTGGVLVQLDASDGVHSDRVLSILEDAEQNIWIGTRGGGLVRLRRTTVETVPPTDGIGRTSAVFERAPGELWVGSRDSGVVVVRGGKIVRRVTSRDGLRGNFIRTIYEDAAGALWIGTQEGLSVFPRGQARAREVLCEGTRVPSVRCLLEDNRGNLWIGSSGDGMYVRPVGSLEVRRVPTSLPVEYAPVRIMLIDRHGTLWVGTRGGLAVLSGDTLRQFVATNRVPIREVFSLHEDDAGALWIGTYGEGIYRLKDGAFARVTRNEGLFDDVAYAILDDGQGGFWMSCNRGISRIARRNLEAFLDGRVHTLSTSSVGSAEGMESVECNGGSQPSGWVAADGTLLFPTMKGVVRVPPGEVATTSREPIPVIEEVRLDRGVMPHPVDVTLEEGERKFELRYTGVSLVLPERIQFRTMLEGFDKVWVDAGAARRVTYTNLPPGEYLFRVEARHPGGLWEGAAATCRLRVPPYLWERGWIQVAGGVAVLALIAVSVRTITTRSLRRRLRELEARQALEAERSRISQDMHDEVGASLTQIAILAELLERSLTDRGVDEPNVRKISATAQDVVGSLDEIVWFIHPKHDTVESLLLYLRAYLAEYFESAAIACRFDLPQEIPVLPLSAEVRRSVFLAAKEAAANVVKHAGASLVRVTARAEGGMIELTIADDGRGGATRSAFGDGLGNMARRMAAAGGSCAIDSAPGAGTTVTIRGPMLPGLPE